jgi:hypothetical protein
LIATADDYAQSHISTIPTPKPVKKDQHSDLEQTFQVQVNNKLIVNIEETAGRCLFSVLSILTDTHPSSDAFVYFSSDEILRLDVASVVRPGVLVAITPRDPEVMGHYGRSQPKPVTYGHCISCDRSTRTLTLEYTDTSSMKKQVPWSWICGMEDSSRKHFILAHSPAAKSIADSDTAGSTSIGHLVLALRWCRHITTDSHLNSVAARVADRAAVLLCTEVVFQDDTHTTSSADDERKLNAQLLDLFEDVQDNESTDLSPKVAIDQRILSSLRIQLRKRLEAASSEREEEQRMWEKQNSGWGDSSFWGGSNKREGRRSPFRAFNRMSSIDSLQ